MKTIIKTLLIFFLPSQLFAQVNADCINAIPLCSNPSFTFFATSGPGSVVDFSVPAQSNISNPTPNPNPPNAGCLQSGELNPQWLLLTVGNAGFLEFVFGAGNNANPQVGYYDWAMWPYSPATCAGIQNNTLPPIRCNWNGSSSGGTGVASASNIAAVGGSSVNFETPILVNACQQFIICISNFSGVNTLVSFQSLGTASLSCNPNCNPNYAMCAGGSVSVVPVNFASLTNPTYSIQPGGTINVTGTFVVSPSTTTSYTTYITGTNAVNAVQTITSVSTVTVNPQPSALATTTQAACSGSISAFNLGLTFNPTAPPSYTVNYSPAIAGITNPQQTSFTGSINPGSYTATILSPGGCQAQTSFSISGPPSQPVFTFNPVGGAYVVNCFNPTVTVNATDPLVNYNWLNGVSAPITGSVGSFSSLSLGTWTVTGTDPISNCVTTHTLTITQNITAPTSSITPNFQLITCSNSAISTVTATAITPSVNVLQNFYWGTGGSVVNVNNTVVVITPPPGTHTYVLVNAVNGCSVTKTFTVATAVGFPTFNVVSPSQNFSIGCVPKNIADIVIINQNTDPPGGSVSFTLLAPGASTNYGFSSVASWTTAIPGTYTVITIDDVTLCQTKIPISIIQNTQQPQTEIALLTQTLNCFVPSLVMQGSSSTPNTIYQWFAPATGVTPGSTFTISTTGNPNNFILGTYSFVVTNNTNACKSTTTVTMYQNIFPPKALIVPQSGNLGAITCKSPSITLVNQSSTGITAASGFPTGNLIIGRLWQGPSPQDPKQNSSNYIASLPGTYSLDIQDMNNGCFSSTVFIVADNRDYPVPTTPTVPVALDCGAKSATLVSNVASTVSNPIVYEWSNINGLIKQGTLTTFPSNATATVALPGDYRLVVTDQYNGCSAIAFNKVVNGVLTGSFDANYTSGYAPLAVTFYNNSYSSLSSQGINSIWNFGNGSTTVSTPSALNVSTTFNQPGTYLVTLFVNKGTCLDSATKVIVVDIPSKLEVPNVFTPNGDGVNDVFFLRTANLTDITASIYDRWGNLVYEVSSSTGNIEWDGKNQLGKNVAAGTYFYIITSNGKDDKSYDTKGTINLYR